MNHTIISIIIKVIGIGIIIVGLIKSTQWYFTLLNIAIPALCFYSAYVAFADKKATSKAWVYSFIVLAILFPLVRLYLTEIPSQLIDVTVCLCLLASMFSFKNLSNPSDLISYESNSIQENITETVEYLSTQTISGYNKFPENGFMEAAKVDADPDAFQIKLN
jgi:CDP-diglyceride synthetase